VLIRHTLALYLECARNVVDKLVSVFGYSMQYRFREILESAGKITRASFGILLRLMRCCRPTDSLLITDRPYAHLLLTSPSADITIVFRQGAEGAKSQKPVGRNRRLVPDDRRQKRELRSY